MQVQTVKELKLKLETLRVNKESAARLESQVAAGQRKAGSIRAEVDSLAGAVEAGGAVIFAFIAVVELTACMWSRLVVDSLAGAVEVRGVVMVNFVLVELVGCRSWSRKNASFTNLRVCGYCL